MFELTYPWLLALLIVPILLVYYYKKWRKEPVIKVSTTQIFAAVQRGGVKHLPISFWVYLLASIILVIALARPRFGDERVVIRAEGIDIILALDLSGSMSAIDIPTTITSERELQKALNSGELKNRLEVAKEELTNFVKERPNDRMGLIGFADMAYSIAPPTLDHGWLIEHLKRLSPGVIGNATGIAAPLASGTHRLKESKAPRRVIVLFTDGVNNVENRITPTQVAELAKELDVIIHTVGVGSDNAIYPINGFGGTRYQKAPLEFNEPMLKEIASTTGGIYFRAADAKGMKQVMEEINQLEKSNFEQPKYVEYREVAPKLAVIALILIILGFIIEHTWKLRLP